MTRKQFIFNLLLRTASQADNFADRCQGGYLMLEFRIWYAKSLLTLKPTIVSSFSISGEHESDMLYLHLGCETDFVDRWVITENTYDFKRRKKKKFLKELVNQDRFSRYRDRVSVNTVSICPEHNRFFKELAIYQPYGQQGYFFIPEQLQRLSAITWLLHNNCNPEATYVLVSDCDEFYCPSHEDHRLLTGLLKAQAPDKLLLARRKFHFDYNNISMQHRSTPLVNLGWALISPFERLAQARFRSAPLYQSQDHLISEYHNCFQLEDLRHKYVSHPHPESFSNLEFLLASKMNHVLVTLSKLNDLQESSDIRCETLSLSHKYIPKFIRENSEYLTNSVDKSYGENRSRCSLYSSW